MQHKVTIVGSNGISNTKSVDDNEYLLNSDDEFFVADKEKDGVNFAYWLVQDFDTKSAELAKCYSVYFNLRILGDYYITPVYSNGKSQSLTISDPTYTREQYTDSTGNVKSDYLYADFVVAYMNSNGILLNGELAQTQNYHTGLIIEFNKNQMITQTDAADAKLTEKIPTYYGFTEAEIKAFAKSANKSLVSDDKTMAMNKFEINNKDYNNKNRLDYYVRFSNTYNYRHYVFKAYYYVYYTDPKTSEVVCEMTNPVYFTLFEIGNSSAITTITTA